MMLINDGLWSRHLTQPEACWVKPLSWKPKPQSTPSASTASPRASIFCFENLTTLLGRLMLHDGRYHQVKRMFVHHFNNKVIALHRERMDR